MADLVYITQAVALFNRLIWQWRRSSLELLLEGSYTQTLFERKYAKVFITWHYEA